MGVEREFAAIEGVGMATHVQIAARLLRDAATFSRNVAAQNEALSETLNDNAGVYDQVAYLVEAAPIDTLDVDAPGPGQ